MQRGVATDMLHCHLGYALAQQGALEGSAGSLGTTARPSCVRPAFNAQYQSRHVFSSACNISGNERMPRSSSWQGGVAPFIDGAGLARILAELYYCHGSRLLYQEQNPAAACEALTRATMLQSTHVCAQRTLRLVGCC